VPKTKHRAQEDIGFTLGDFINLFAVEQKVDEFGIHLHRVATCKAVYGAKVVDAGVFMVDIEQFVVFFEDRRNLRGTAFKPFHGVSCVTIYIGDSIEVVKEDYSARINLCFLGSTSCKTQEESQQAQDGDSSFHLVQKYQLLFGGKISER
jgi:hypothetical protein